MVVSLVKKLRIVTPVALALILISLFLPAQCVTIGGIGGLPFENSITLSVGQGIAYAADTALQ